MKLSFRLLPCMTVLASLLLASGCGHSAKLSPEEQAAAEQRLQSELNTVFTTAESALTEGRTNEAISSIEAAFNKRAYSAYRPQILEAQLRLLIRCGQLDAARQRASKACTDPTLAAGASELIYRFSRDQGDIFGAQAWAASLIDLPGVTHDTLLQALRWDISDLITLKKESQVLTVLGKAVQAQETAADSLTLLRFTIEALLAANRLESVEQVLTLASTVKTNPAEINRLVTATRVQVYATRSDWTSLTGCFPAAVAALSDSELNNLLQTVITATAKAGNTAVFNQCADLIIRSPTAGAKPMTVSTAVRKLGENTMEANKNAFPGWLMTMLRAKVPADPLIDLFTRFFYSFSEQPASLKELLAFGELLAQQIQDEETRNDVKIKVLDGYFLLQDYDHALTMLEARIPGANRTEQWHAAAIVKIKAHRALQQNQPREAVKFFRDFMGELRASKETEISDPVTGVFFPREMVLGRNAKRIGDILAGIPDAAEAAKAYAEANELYQQALKATSDATAIKVIDAEIAQLPKSAR